MSLKFPNVRLFIFDLLMYGGVTGPQAIAKTAFEYGLIPQDAIDEVLRQRADAPTCHCMSTMKNILVRYFMERDKNATQPLDEIDTEDLWTQFIDDTVSYTKKSGRTDFRCDESGKRSNCVATVPAMFDLLLQHIRRYP